MGGSERGNRAGRRGVGGRGSTAGRWMGGLLTRGGECVGYAVLLHQRWVGGLEVGESVRRGVGYGLLLHGGGWVVEGVEWGGWDG